VLVFVILFGGISPGLTEELRLVDLAAIAFDEGRYEKAAELLKQAYALDRDPLHLYNIGRAYEEAREYDKAFDYFQRYLDTGPSHEDTATARKALTRMRGQLFVRITVKANRPDATLLVDGEPAGITPYSGEVRAGKRILAVRKEGFVGEVKDVELAQGRDHDLSFTLTELIEPARKRASAAPWVVTGLGGAGVGFGAYMLYRAKELRSSLANPELNEHGQVIDPSQAEAWETREKADSLGTGGAVLLAVGGAALLGGLVWGLVDATAGKRRTTGSAWMLPNDGGVSIGYSVSF